VGDINKAYTNYGSNRKNLIVISICKDGSDSTVKNKATLAGILYPVISGSSGGSTIFSSYGISYTPTITLINPQKKIVEKDIWPTSKLLTTLKKYSINGPAIDFVGTWSGQGVYYRNSDSATWVKLASPADHIALGDCDGDTIDDLIGIWPDQGGVWVRYSKTGNWANLSPAAKHIAAGDMNGDGKDELLGTWDGQGVFYREPTGAWEYVASPADLVEAGDLDGDGTDDCIGLWPSQDGVWVKYSSTGAWSRLSSAARDIAAGDMNGDGREDFVGTWDDQGVFYLNSISGAWVKLGSPAEQVTCGDLDGDGIDDLIGLWTSQGGVWVKYSKSGTWEKLSSPTNDIAVGRMRAVVPMSVEKTAETVAPVDKHVGFPESGFRLTNELEQEPGVFKFKAEKEKK
jgi:hypothetical protein